jgi:hypothetical protein
MSNRNVQDVPNKRTHEFQSCTNAIFLHAPRGICDPNFVRSWCRFGAGPSFNVVWLCRRTQGLCLLAIQFLESDVLRSGSTTPLSRVASDMGPSTWCCFFLDIGWK